MNGGGKPDKPMVPGKPTNKGQAASSPAERVEGRGLAKGNSGEQNQVLGSETDRPAPCAAPNTKGCEETLRLSVNTRGRSPRRGGVIPHAGICAGVVCKGHPYRDHPFIPIPILRNAFPKA